MKQILILNTGGTFSSRMGEHGLTPSISGKEILNMLQPVRANVNVEIEDYCSLDSSNITPEDWQHIAEKIAGCVSKYDGFVIIHGTDTMAYTASMLSFMLQNLPCPVVLTGSQRPLYELLSDAICNLQCAIWMAASETAGVFVAFDRRIMLGCRTSKVRTVSFNAFESINYPDIGEINSYGLQLYLKQRKNSLPFSVQTSYSDKIAILRLFPGMDLEIFSFLKEQGYEGIYIEGFGLGGVPFLKNDFTAEIRKASDSGMPILVGSQCRYEGSNLNIYETGQRILACGGIPVYDMTLEAVATKLMWCLGQTKSEERIRQLFASNLVGEVQFTKK